MEKTPVPDDVIYVPSKELESLNVYDVMSKWFTVIGLFR